MSTTIDTLDGALRSLTEAQHLAVDWGNHAFLLLAGPGSGKTRVLTTRIALLLDESQDETFKILALTFTNRAADEMRQRIDSLIPEMEDRLFVGTFHSFCTEVLRRHGIEIGLKSDFDIYSTDADRIEILKGAIDKHVSQEDIQILGDAKLLPIINRIQANLIEPQAVSSKFRNSEYGASVGRIFAAYEQALLDDNAQDFNSLVMNAFRLFSQYPAIAKRYRRTYRYWSIDEFQDTNYAQYALIQTLAGDDFDNVFVVADDDQVIYQWNGASYKRLDQFSERFSPEVMQLPTNFRCPAEVVQIGNKLVLNNSLRRSDKEPIMPIEQSTGKKSESVRLLIFADEYAEAAGIALDVQSRIDEGATDIAVIGRTKRLLENSAKELSDLSIAHRISQRKDDFDSPHYVWLSCCLKQAYKRADERNIRLLVESFNTISDLDLVPDDIIAEGQSKTGDLLRTWADVARESSDLDSVASLADAVKDHLVESLDYREFARLAQKWFKKNTNVDFAEFEEDNRAWSGLVRDIQSALGRNHTIEAFIQELKMRSKEPPRRAGEVLLTTIHGAKGNEFEDVYVIGMAEDVLPSFHSKKEGDSSPQMEEERRNCFVAITRTKKFLTLSFAHKYFNWPKQPSRFLREMDLVE